jgi:hypothetical protein
MCCSERWRVLASAVVAVTRFKPNSNLRHELYTQPVP